MADDTKPDVPLTPTDATDTGTHAMPDHVTADTMDALVSALASDSLVHAAHDAFIPVTDDSLLGVIISPEAMVSVDHTLDQLTTSVDLFDVQPFDFGSDHTS